MTHYAGWLQALAVALGSGLGGLARWGVAWWINPLWAGFPLGTLAVNCLGGLFIGAALVGFGRVPNELLRLLLVTGLLGGLTTFSAYSAESLQLLQRGALGLAMLHTLANVLGALGCAALGVQLARACLG
ncbi:MAG: fluoride efflux transporter CrcB [Burkholderiaceae bacterium]|nr:fluoride efflux transporter CrcB [Burkholderiaceae bacterium]MDH3459462.1 fluoride efflux transporter CrcB [Burkholderiaceae bacterium]